MMGFEILIGVVLLVFVFVVVFLALAAGVRFLKPRAEEQRKGVFENIEPRARKCTALFADSRELVGFLGDDRRLLVGDTYFDGTEDMRNFYVINNKTKKVAVRRYPDWRCREEPMESFWLVLPGRGDYDSDSMFGEMVSYHVREHAEKRRLQERVERLMLENEVIAAKKYGDVYEQEMAHRLEVKGHVHPTPPSQLVVESGNAEKDKKK